MHERRDGEDDGERSRPPGRPVAPEGSGEHGSHHPDVLMGPAVAGHGPGGCHACSVAVTFVGPPGRLFTLNAPPSSSIRFRMPFRPIRPLFDLLPTRKPRPSSSTSRVTLSSVPVRVIQTVWAAACLATLASASRVTDWSAI